MKTSILIFPSQLRLVVLLSLSLFHFSRVTAALCPPVVHARTTTSALIATAGTSPGRPPTWEVRTTPQTTTTATTAAMTSNPLSRTRATATTATDVTQAPNKDNNDDAVIHHHLVAQPPALNPRSDPAPTIITDTATPPSTITPFTLPSGVSDISDVQEKWYLTTYWSCVAFDTTTHCGWHEPVLPGGDDSVAGAVAVFAGAGAGMGRWWWWGLVLVVSGMLGV